MSLSAGTVVGELLVPDFEDWTKEEQDAFAEKIDHPVRKTAHATEYAILGILSAGTFGTFGMTGKRRAAAAWGVAAIYAATDEFHQLFVAGRSCQISDVMLDSAGAAAGIAVLFAVSHIIGRKN